MPIIEWITKYWMEFAFGLVIAGGGLFWKRFENLMKVEKISQEKEFYDKLDKKIEEKIEEGYKKSREDDQALQTEIDNIITIIKSLKKGMLSIQGRAFKDACREALKEDHVLTLTEYENLGADHEAYNGLDGNHEGDALWALVQEKAKETFGKK